VSAAARGAGPPVAPPRALTDSTTPKVLPASNFVPTAGSSTYTMSPSSLLGEHQLAVQSDNGAPRAGGWPPRRRAASRARARSGWVRAEGARLRVVGDAHGADVALNLEPLREQ